MIDYRDLLSDYQHFVKIYLLVAEKVLKCKFEDEIKRYFLTIIFSSKIYTKLGIKQDEIKKQFGPEGNFAEMLADLSVKDFR